MPFITKDFSKVIMNNYQDCGITSLKTERGKIKPYILSKGTTASHFWKNLKRNILQT